MIGPARWSAPVPCFAVRVLRLEVILLRRAVFQALKDNFSNLHTDVTSPNRALFQLCAPKVQFIPVKG